MPPVDIRPSTVPPLPKSVLQLFDQGYWWRTREGQWMPIADMGPEHRYNTARMLEHNARYHQLRYEAAQIEQILRLGGPDDDAMWSITTPCGWLHDTALYRALEGGLPRRGKKRHQLAARAQHWSSCPMRLRRRNRATDATCTCAEVAQADQTTNN